MTKAEEKAKEIAAELARFDLSFGKKLVAGVDEAGRGPLAGPVVCAACIMQYDDIISGINDSKKVSEKKREELYETITQKALAWSVAIIGREVIDDINILNATKLGMKQSLEKLSIMPDIVLADAVKIDTKLPQEAIIKGDAKSYAIAAASIIAKVTRDRLMREYDEKYPQYGFAKHKGYGTKVHVDALIKHGRCDIHRLSFLTKILPEDVNDEGA